MIGDDRIKGAYLYQFHLSGDKLGSTNVVAHKIINNDDKPVFHKNYRYPNILREEDENKLMNSSQAV